MLTPAEQIATVQTSDEILERRVVLPVWRCKWCSPHRYFLRRLDGQTMYVDPPTDGMAPSDGICRPCYERVKASHRLGVES